MSSPSNEALARWKRVAAGERDEDLDGWLRGVAAAIVAEVFEGKFEHAARRAEAAQRAVGWRGRLNSHEELDWAALLPETQKMKARELAEFAPNLIDVHGTTQEAADRIRRVRKIAKSSR